jgi:hypothetical protein
MGNTFLAFINFYMILSRPSGGVTYKNGVLDWTHRLQFLITIYNVALQFDSSQYTHWVFLASCPSSTPRYRLPTADDPRPTATAHSTHSILNCLFLSPTVLAGALSNNWLSGALTNNWLTSGALLSNSWRLLKAKVKVILRPTVSRPFFLGGRHPSETHGQFFPFSP